MTKSVIGSFLCYLKENSWKRCVCILYLLNKHSFIQYSWSMRCTSPQPMCSFSDIIPSAAPWGHNSRQQQHNSTTAVNRGLSQTAWHQTQPLGTAQAGMSLSLGLDWGPDARPDSGQGGRGCALHHHSHHYQHSLNSHSQAL